MGATDGMYSGPWREIPDTCFVNWPEMKRFVSLAEIAKNLIDHHSITSGDSVGGSSLGGMVSIEISKIQRTPLVVLIGSARNRDEIAPLLLKMARFSDIAPIAFIQMIAGRVPSQAAGMFADSDPDFIRQASKALQNWEGYGSTCPDLLRIHCSRDCMIPCPREGHVIKGAGHLVAMTHAEQCVGIVRGALEESGGNAIEN